MTKHYELATSSWGTEELDAINSVLESGFTTMGKNVVEYEKQFAEFMGAKYAVMVNSGSSANLLMIASLFFRQHNPLKRGDEIIVPAVSWSTTYYPLQQYGLKLKFVDIDINTLNYDLSALRRAITPQTRAIMAVNLLGNPNDFDVIQELIRDTDIILVEDNCESMGADLNGKKTGTFGIMGTFSTFFSHHISTMEGGVIITDDTELYHILLCLRAHGWTRNLPSDNLVCGKKSDNAFYESFRFVLPGYNVRPLEIEAAVGIQQLKKLPEFNMWRRKNAQYFQSKFHDNPYFLIQSAIGNPSWFGFSLILKPESGIQRDEFVKFLTDAGIDTRPIVAGDFTKNEVLKYFDYEIFGEMKNAANLDKNGLFVGNHQFDITDKIDYLAQTIDEFIKSRK